MARDLLEVALRHSFVQRSHVLGLEWQLQSRHFIRDAPQRPNVALEVIRLVAPHLWARVVRSARLSIVQAILPRNFRYVQVANLDDIVIRQEDVRRLNKEHY